MSDTSGTEPSTDEAILQNIGEGDEPTSDAGTGTEGIGTPTDPTQTALTPSGDKDTIQGDASQQQKPVSGPQDLKDREGNVIATGGKERRFYETAQREKGRADGLAREVETLTAQAEAINSAGTLGTQYDLTPEELTTGAQIVAAYKKDPVGTIQYMLTQAQASGHNVEAITTGGMNMDAVKQMVDNALKPLVAEQTERADTQAANTRALEIYNEFSTKYPDASVHENALARLLKQEPSLSPEAAYFKLRSYYHERNLDWTKSLEQLQQAQTASGVGNTQQALPEGGVSQDGVTDTTRVADVNMSFDDIIRESMKDAGIN